MKVEVLEMNSFKTESTYPLECLGGTSLVVKWWRLHASRAEDAGLIPGWLHSAACT